MFCPNCAAPIEGVKFCRGCGTNVELVPQAISGELAEVTDTHTRRRRGRPASMERAASNFFTGVGFVLVALAIGRFMPGGRGWWFWMLLPAFASIGSGIGQYLRARSEQQLQLNSQARVAPVASTLPNTPSPLDLPKAPTTSNLGEKGSVTEHTTRHLG